MVSYDFPGTVSAGSFFHELPLIVRTIPSSYISQQRWFGSKASKITGIELFDAAVLRDELPFYIILMIALHYDRGISELYHVPLVLRGPAGMGQSGDANGNIIMTITTAEGQFELYDALGDDGYLRHLFYNITVSADLKSLNGKFIFRSTQMLHGVDGDKARHSVDSLRHLKGEQSNTSVIYNESWIMKNFRKITSGTNPDVEIPLFLTTMTSYRNIPPVAGYIEHVMEDGTQSAVASLQAFIPNQGDGWRYTLDYLEQLYRMIIEMDSAGKTVMTVQEKTHLIEQHSGSYLHNMNMLGNITGNLHNALASDVSSLNFTPEPITHMDISSWTAHSQSYCAQVLDGLSHKSRTFSPSIREKIDEVISRRSFYMKKIENLGILAEEAVWKIRYHNDYHLGQVLKTESGFIIIDFEGEPARPLDERRAKHSPLKDVAGMMRSFNYALYAALFTVTESNSGQKKLLENAGKLWEWLTRESFMTGYLDATVKENGAAPFLPRSRSAILDVLSVFELDKAVYELNYELNNRPSWVVIPLEYLLSLT